MIIRRFLIGASAIMVVAVVFLVAPVSAVDTYGGGSPQLYSAETPLDTGTIVQLESKGAKSVKTVGQSDLQNMLGVVVDRNALSFTITNDAIKNPTYVAVSGTYNTLVSTQNGTINVGDYVTLSSLDGVAMKAGDASEQGTVFGRAQGSFDGKGVTLGAMTLKDSAGGSKKVTIGIIPVSIAITRNPNHKSTKVNTPDFLQRVGEQIAEKEVSPIRIYLSMAITAISLMAAIIVLYSGVRSGVISIGRNPMSKKSIFRALLEIILTSLLIVIVGLFAVYLLLKL